MLSSAEAAQTFFPARGNRREAIIDVAEAPVVKRGRVNWGNDGGGAANDDNEGYTKLQSLILLAI